MSQITRKPMLQITRIDGRVNHIGIAAEKGFMLNILNKTDKNVVKVERGILSINQKEEKREFEATAVIYQSKNHESMELANEALKMAKASDAENAALRAQLDELKKGESGKVIDAVKAELEQQKQIAAQIAEAQKEAEAKAAAAQDENAKLKAELEALKKKSKEAK